MIVLAAILSSALISLPAPVMPIGLKRRKRVEACENVEPRVIKLTVEHTGAPPARVRPSARLKDLGADDLLIVELEMAVQAEVDFERDVPDGNSVTVSDLISYAWRYCRS